MRSIVRYMSTSVVRSSVTPRSFPPRRSPEETRRCALLVREGREEGQAGMLELAHAMPGAGRVLGEHDRADLEDALRSVARLDLDATLERDHQLPRGRDHE